MPPAQPMTGGRGIGRAMNMAPIGRGMANGEMGMASGMGVTNYMPSGLAMPGPQTVPPMGRGMGRAAAQENLVSRNVAMANTNGHAVVNGNSNTVSAPPGKYNC